jgi:hypothetical protein
MARFDPLVLSLAATSALFFYFFGLVIPNLAISLSGWNPSIPFLRSAIFSGGPAILGLISFRGSVLTS